MIKTKNGNLYIRLLIEYPTFNEEQIDLLNTLFKYKDKEVISDTNVTFSKYEKILLIHMKIKIKYSNLIY